MIRRDDDVFRNGEPGLLAVGHAVAISREAGGRVVRALASDATRMPAIGIVAALRGSAVFVRARGAIKVPPVVLSPDDYVHVGSTYYVNTSTPGSLTRLKPSQGIVQTVALGRRRPKSVHLFIGHPFGAADEDTANLTFGSLDVSDLVDGATDTFVLPASTVEGSVRVYWNGQRLLRGVDYAEAGTEVVLLFMPAAGHQVEIEYGTTHGNVLIYAIADLASQVPAIGGSYALPEAAVAGTMRVYRNGQRLIPGKHFVEDSTTTFHLVGIDLASGEDLEVSYEKEGTEGIQSRQADLSNQIGLNGGVFSLPEVAITGSMSVYWNGQRLITGKHFVEDSTTTFHLVEATLAVGEDLEVTYEKEGTKRVRSRQADLSNQIGLDGGVFSLPEAAIAGSMRVYRNGQRMVLDKHFFELSTDTFEFVVDIDPATGETVEAEYTVAAS